LLNLPNHTPALGNWQRTGIFFPFVAQFHAIAAATRVHPQEKTAQARIPLDKNGAFSLNRCFPLPKRAPLRVI
jgi:hypothetical protein